MADISGILAALMGNKPQSADDQYGNGDVLWMLHRPEVNWGAFMPDLQNQRRSENVEDLRGQPWSPSLYAYRYLGMESSPQDVLSSLLRGIQHPLTRPSRPVAPPADPQLANSSMADVLGINSGLLDGAFGINGGLLGRKR